jgi:quinol monooxygenase YgiN
MLVSLALLLCAGCGKGKSKERDPAGERPAEPAPAPAPADAPAETTAPAAEPVFAAIARYQVADYDRFVEAFRAGRAARAHAGVVAHAISRVEGEAGGVIVHLQGRSLEKLRDHVRAGESAEATSAAGVRGKPEVWLAQMSAVGPLPPDGVETVSAVATFEVRDFDAWLKSFRGSAGALEEAGVVTWAAGTSVESPHHVLVHAVGTDLDRLRELAGSEATKRAMKEAGVVGDLEVWYARDAEIWIAGGSAIARLEVEDFSAWKRGFDESAAGLREAGIRFVTVSRDRDDERRAIVHAVSRDLAALRAYASSDAMKAAMAGSGVVGEPEIWFVENVEIASPRAEVEGPLAGAVARFEVADFDEWKQRFDDAADARAEAGVVAHGVHRVPGDPRAVVVHYIGTDSERLEEIVGSPEAERAAKEAGQTGPAETWFGTALEPRRL